ncbi:MAG: hypothetical protein RQ761_08525 [Bacteroidales bacterium]|nr:hypothetical protein [Bacteroidales bacterium]
MKKTGFLILAALLFTVSRAHAQGCNDAGLCGMGDLDGRRLGTGSQYNTQLSYFFGLGEQQILINTIQFEQRFAFMEDRGQVFLQLPFHYIYGKLGNTYGVGDVSLGVNYTYLKKDDLAASFLIAGKLPSNGSDKTIDEKVAPMVYQSSLGTYDLALGANLFYQKWQFGLGYLKPFGSNQNNFDPSEWQGNNDAEEFIQMSDLKRGDDAMIRVNRFFYSKKNRFNTGLLALYRMQKDIVKQNGGPVALKDSDGLTLNINLGYYRVLKNKDAVTLSVAAPLITREVRVDGLTRNFVMMFTYAFGKKEKSMFDSIKFN